MAFFSHKRIYADAAAATPVSRAAMREFNRVLPLFGNPGAIHHEAALAKQELESARKKVADAIGAHADEIIFTASGTESNNLALQGLLRPLLIKEGSAHAITTAIEHQSVLEPLRALRAEGLALDEVSVDSEGLLISNSILDKVRPNTKLVSVQLVNSEIGTILPVREIAKDLRRAKQKIYLHTDASQAPLWMELSVEKLGVDLMTLDAQKVMGPKGVGILFVKRGVPLHSILFGGKQEKNLRGGTENAPAASAFAVALLDAQKHAASRAKKTAAVRDYVWKEITRLIPDARLNGPALEKRSPNNLNISVPGLDAEMAVVSMDALGVAVSTRSACSTGTDEPSHVIKAIGIPAELQKTAIRITLLPDASRADARRIAQALLETATRYRRN